MSVPTSEPDPPIAERVEALATQLRARGWYLAVAESCTGGALARALTDPAGSSAWFDCGLVTYSNRAKEALLGVPSATLARHGAVSGETAGAMVAGLLARTSAHIGVSITGIAGPGGESADKPVGLVWFGWQTRHGTPSVHSCHFPGDRAAVRQAAVRTALDGLIARCAAETEPKQ